MDYNYEINEFYQVGTLGQILKILYVKNYYGQKSVFIDEIGNGPELRKKLGILIEKGYAKEIKDEYYCITEAGIEYCKPFANRF